MSETTEKKTTRTTSKPPQQPLSERIAHDLTYVSDQTGEQVEAWQWVKEQFEGFRNHIFNTLEHTTLPARFTQTDEFTLYTFSARLAERWANAAIARDWKAGFEFDPNATIPEYPLKSVTNAPERNSLCFDINVHIYFLGVSIAQALPEGRPLSCFATELEVMRGWLMDCINEHANEDTRQKRKPTYFNVKP